MTQSKKIAVTGGIGSGKTEFCSILNKMGFPVFSCDEIYAELLLDKDYLSALERKFPTCFTDGILNKERLARTVFSDKKARKELDALAHPRIMSELLRRMEEHPLSFAEVPLLFEGGFEGLFDHVVVIVREKENRIAAIGKRDGLSREQILARMNAQCSEEFRKRKQTTVIENNGTAEELARQAELFLKKIS